MEATLCKPCRKALKRLHLTRFRNPRRYYYSEVGNSKITHSSFLSFRNAVFEGCFVCGLLWIDARFGGRVESFEGMDSFIADLWLHGVESYQGIAYEVLNYAVNVTQGIMNDPRKGDYSESRESVEIPLEPLSLLEKKRFSPFLSRHKRQSKRFAQLIKSHSQQRQPMEICDTISSGLYLHGRSWIQDCLDHHESCQQSHGELTWAPERLIKVQEKSEMEAYKLRLIETLVVPADGRYTTLSHRWSGQSFLKLTRDNFQQLSHGFSSSDMPQTFRDAVSATYHLGFHYLWIDSLCIVQDDLDDWARQSGQMHQIYTSAVCNLAASWAEDCTKPMFSQRQDSSKLANTVNVRARVRSKKMRLVDENLWRRSIEESPLQQRGWIFQERLLSPRKLHFCEDQILWECKKLHASEDWHTGLWPSRLLPLAKQTDTPELSSLYYPPRLKLSRKQLESFEKWWKNMRIYSSTSLTRNTDRLIAISGIASAFAVSQGWEASAYVAGMWREVLELSMFWVVHGLAEGREQSGSRDYVAPSFSWTSKLQQVEPAWDSPGIGVPIPYFRISGVHLNYGSADKFGILLEGSHLRVTGPVWAVRWHFLDFPMLVRRATLRIDKFQELHANIHLDHQAWSMFDEDIFCIPGGKSDDDIDSKTAISLESWIPTVLILLRPMPKHGVGAFRRIGLVTNLRRDEDRYSAPISFKHSDLEPSGIPSIEYHPETGEHAIKIF